MTKILTIFDIGLYLIKMIVFLYAIASQEIAYMQLTHIITGSGCFSSVFRYWNWPISNTSMISEAPTIEASFV